MQVEVSGNSFDFPNQCPCCNGATDAELALSASKSSGKRVVHTKTKVWDVPYCNHCLTHIQRTDQARVSAKMFAVLAAIVSALTWLGFSFSAGLGVGAFILVVGFIPYWLLTKSAKEICRKDCARVGRAIAYLGWERTVHKFEVASPQYAQLHSCPN